MAKVKASDVCAIRNLFEKCDPGQLERFYGALRPEHVDARDPNAWRWRVEWK